MARNEAEYSRMWRAKNPERAREISRNWTAKNKDKTKAYREKNKESRNAATKKWKQENPERVALSERKSWLKKNYGLTLEQYEAISSSQNHSCAICHSHRSNERTGNLVVDHCHGSGEMRGLLCNDCNRNLVAQRSDPEIFYRAAEYIAAFARRNERRAA